MPPDPDYEVGYKKPPQHTRFKQGQSGNPRAKPKRSHDFASLLTEILDERVTMTENGQPRRGSRQKSDRPQRAGRPQGDAAVPVLDGGDRSRAERGRAADMGIGGDASSILNRIVAEWAAAVPIK